MGARGESSRLTCRLPVSGARLAAWRRWPASGWAPCWLHSLACIGSPRPPVAPFGEADPAARTAPTRSAGSHAARRGSQADLGRAAAHLCRPRPPGGHLSPALPPRALSRPLREHRKRPPGPAAALRSQASPTGRALSATACPRCCRSSSPRRALPREQTSARRPSSAVVARAGWWQMLAFHMGLFQMGKTASVLAAMSGPGGAGRDVGWRLARRLHVALIRGAILALRAVMPASREVVVRHALSSAQRLCQMPISGERA